MFPKYLILFLFFFPSLMRAQENQVLNGDKTRLNNEVVFQNALKLGDYVSAVSALHQVIAIDGEKSSWRDTLLNVYFNAGNYVSSHLLSKSLLQERIQDDRLLEINAISLVQLGAQREALEVYEMLYRKSKKVEHAYELASLQYQIKRLAEAELTLSQASSVEVSDSLGVRFSVGQNGTQVINLKAAIFHLRGLVAYDLKQTENAKKHFNQALEIEPTFVLAKQNVDALAASSVPKKKTK